jgi:hypothetical protein
MEAAETPTPLEIVIGRGNLIESKKYELKLREDTYSLLIERFENLISFKIRQINNICLYQYFREYKYEDILNLLSLIKNQYEDLSKIFIYFDKMINKQKVFLDYNNQNKLMILKVKRTVDIEEFECNIELEETKLENDEINKLLIDEIKILKMNNNKQIEENKYKEIINNFTEINKQNKEYIKKLEEKIIKLENNSVDRGHISQLESKLNLIENKIVNKEIIKTLEDKIIKLENNLVKKEDIEQLENKKVDKKYLKNIEDKISILEKNFVQKLFICQMENRIKQLENNFVQKLFICQMENRIKQLENKLQNIDKYIEEKINSKLNFNNEIGNNFNNMHKVIIDINNNKNINNNNNNNSTTNKFLDNNLPQKTMNYQDNNAFNMGQVPQSNQNIKQSVNIYDQISVIFKFPDYYCKIYQPISVKCSLNDKLFNVIENYKVLSGNNSKNLSFMFNNNFLNPQLTVGESGLTDKSTIIVYS